MSLVPQTTNTIPDIYGTVLIIFLLPLVPQSINTIPTIHGTSQF